MPFECWSNTKAVDQFVRELEKEDLIYETEKEFDPDVFGLSEGEYEEELESI